MLKYCEYCQEAFEAQRSTARFCSPSHRVAASRVAQVGVIETMDDVRAVRAQQEIFDPYGQTEKQAWPAQVAASGVVTIPAESLRGGDSLDQLSDRAFEALERFRSPGQTLVEANEELILSNLDNEWFAELYRDAQLWRNRNGSGPVVEPLGRESGMAVSDEEDVEDVNPVSKLPKHEYTDKVSGGWPLTFSERVEQYERGEEGLVLGKLDD